MRYFISEQRYYKEMKVSKKKESIYPILLRRKKFSNLRQIGLGNRNFTSHL